MKILHVFKSYFPTSVGGIENVIKNLTDQTTLLGCKNTLLTLYKGESKNTIFQDQLEIIQFPMTLNIASCPFGFQFALEFKKIASQYDIVHFHFPWPFAEFLQVMFNPKTPIIVTYHSDIVRQKTLKIFYSPFMKAFLRSANYIVPTSVNCMISSKDLKDYLNKCHVIPIGINTKNYPFPSQEKIDHWKNRVGNNFMLFIGVLRYYKGLHILLDAIKNTNIPLVIAGSGPMEKALKAQAELLKLDNVHFVGFVDEEDKVALLKSCRAVVVPSHLRAEAFCISLVEGLMFGKPLISTEIGTGTSFVNQHNETGFVIEPNDIAALRSALQKINSDDTLHKKMSENAKARYEKLFTAKQMGEKYYTLYEKVLTNR